MCFKLIVVSQDLLDHYLGVEHILCVLQEGRRIRHRQWLLRVGFISLQELESDFPLFGLLR